MFAAITVTIITVLKSLYKIQYVLKFHCAKRQNKRRSEGQTQRDRGVQGNREVIHFCMRGSGASGTAKRGRLPCLFLWLSIPASSSPVPPPFASYSSPAQALMQKTANWAKYSYFYPCQLPDSSLCCYTTVSAGAHQGIKTGQKRVICMGGRKVPFLVAMFSIAGSSWWGNGTVSVVTFFIGRKWKFEGG